MGKCLVHDERPPGSFVTISTVAVLSAREEVQEMSQELCGQQQMRQLAVQAIKILNMIKVHGKPIRVNKASQDKKQMHVGANVLR